MITRFAPSPTGYLHLGHAFSALTAWQLAREAQGDFVLRIEDIDLTRCRPAFETAIQEDLDWLGLDWRLPVRRQQDHFADYAAALDAMRDRGLAYRCFRTRSEVAEAAARAPQQGDRITAPSALRPSADEEQSLLNQGRPYSWRFDMAAAKRRLGGSFSTLSFEEKGAGPDGESGTITRSCAAIDRTLGDTIIGRKDNGTSYHIACVVDDALQGVTDVVRGNDLFGITPFHVVLQKLLGLPTPRYHHHRILRDETGMRFAKRNRAVSLRALRAAGRTPRDIRTLCGL